MRETLNERTRPLPAPPVPAPPAKPELLAPADSWEAALAALEAGADAVCVGLRRWGATGRAQSFELADLKSLVPLAHAEGRKVYVALNTLLREEEMPAVLAAVWDFACLGIDGLSLQDLGLWAACREAFPEIPLHASTEMSVHNSAGVRRLESMGFSRVVLGRECTIPEIAQIHRSSRLPLEVFVHGALCYSVSGLCLASSVLFGRSASRGQCAEPCRWGYRRSGDDAEVHPFSCADLCLIERVWDLAAAGVSSLKIEGRLKSADYVHAVVRAYRKVLDAPERDRAGALGAARQILKSVASRTQSEGYAFHPRPKEVLRHGEEPGLGQRVGSVAAWKDGVVTVRGNERLRSGDRVRIAPSRTGEGKTVVLRNVQTRKGASKVELTFPWAWRAHPGDAVYRVKDAKGEELEQRLSKRARSLAGPSGFPVFLRVSFSAGSIRLDARCGPETVRLDLPLETYPALEHCLDAQVLEQHLGRLGASAYRLVGLEVEGDLPPVVIPPSAFKGIRRAVIAALDAARAASGRDRLARARALRAARPPEPAPSFRLWVGVEAAGSAAALPWESVHKGVVPINRDCLKGRGRILKSSGSRERLVWALPPWIAEGDLPRYRSALETLAREGYAEVLLSNLGHLGLVEGLPFRAHAGPELHALNGWAGAALGKLGCCSFLTSPESDRQNLKAISVAGWPVAPAVLLYGDLPLFTTRLDPTASAAAGAPVVMRGGEELRCVETFRPLGLSWSQVFGARPLSWSQHRQELQELGVADFHVWFRGRPHPDREIRSVLSKVLGAKPVPQATGVNFDRIPAEGQSGQLFPEEEGI